MNPDTLMDSKLKCVFEMPFDPSCNREGAAESTPVSFEDKNKRVADGTKGSPKVTIFYFDNGLLWELFLMILIVV